MTIKEEKIQNIFKKKKRRKLNLKICLGVRFLKGA